MLKAVMGATLVAMGLSTGALALDSFDLGGAAKGDPSVVWYKFGGKDAVAVFVRGPGDLMYAQVGDGAGGGWTGWVPIGNEKLKGSPACVAPTPDLIDCVGLGAGNAVYHVRYDAKAHQWTGWENLGGLGGSDPGIARLVEDGTVAVNVYVRGPGDLLFLNTFADGAWNDWDKRDVKVSGAVACTDILVVGNHCYDSSGGSAVEFSDVTRQSGGDVFIDQLGGAVKGKVSAVATGAKGDTLRVFVNGPGKRLWFKKWAGAWEEWKQLPVTVNSAPGCAIRKSGGAAWCASVESNGTVKMIMIAPGEI